jgi:hypothetical protein
MEAYGLIGLVPLVTVYCFVCWGRYTDRVHQVWKRRHKSLKGDGPKFMANELPTSKDTKHLILQEN